eukprot:TRINITY_DN2014_c0_g1_i2.p1 TRINITY_DN2014_c0_g1~~TRINITY_DN2014_c0_g1_i2.p1  ORF type:complete len:307 (+),score=34.58 TRINITY_DN2014_c0_g1_i2:176-1096(+)
MDMDYICSFSDPPKDEMNKACYVIFKDERGSYVNNSLALFQYIEEGPKESYGPTPEEGWSLLHTVENMFITDHQQQIVGDEPKSASSDDSLGQESENHPIISTEDGMNYNGDESECVEECALPLLNDSAQILRIAILANGQRAAFHLRNLFATEILEPFFAFSDDLGVIMGRGGNEVYLFVDRSTLERLKCLRWKPINTSVRARVEQAQQQNFDGPYNDPCKVEEQQHYLEEYPEDVVFEDEYNDDACLSSQSEEDEESCVPSEEVFQRRSILNKETSPFRKSLYFKRLVLVSQHRHDAIFFFVGI